MRASGQFVQYFMAFSPQHLLKRPSLSHPAFLCLMASNIDKGRNVIVFIGIKISLFVVVVPCYTAFPRAILSNFI
jgi:hypothetical protein